MTICVRRIAKAGIGLMFEICDPTVLTIFCENNKAPIPIKNDPKKNSFLSSIIKFKSKKFKFNDKNGEYTPTIAAVKCGPRAKAAMHPKNIRESLIW